MSIKVTGDKNPVKKLVDQWQNKQEFLQEVGDMLLESTRERILTTKTDPMGRAWKPWARSTALARARDGSSARGLLYKSGNLVDSLQVRIDGGMKVSVSTNVPYAQFLQNGTNRMPPRAFLGASKQDEKQIQAIWNRWMKI
jgi:phage gpG-like protein